MFVGVPVRLTNKEGGGQGGCMAMPALPALPTLMPFYFALPLILIETSSTDKQLYRKDSDNNGTLKRGFGCIPM